MCANIHCLFLLNTRIDANVEDTQLNVEMAHTEILKYFQSVSSNRWLMIKIFLVLIIFFIIFVVFLAWEGTTLSVRRGENGAKGFEGGRNRLWTYGRMCKNTSGLCRRGLWLPGEGLGGGSDVQWWGDFCQSNLDVNSVTVDFFSLTLEGDDGDADEGGTEI